MKKKFSIITVSFNCEKTIRDTIESVFVQDHPNIEYIIVDGDSKDGTMDIVWQYGDKIDKVVSEPDNGIYDAMNKGIGMATGDIIGFLNADDFYADSTVLESVAEPFLKDSIDIVYGDLCYVKKDKPTEIVRYWKSSEYRRGLFERGWAPAHPTFFVRKAVYENHGVFDTNYSLAADYELMARFLYKYGVKAEYVPSVMVKMRLGGETNKSLLNIVRQNIEIIKASKKNGIDMRLLRFFISKIINRVNQYIANTK